MTPDAPPALRPRNTTRGRPRTTGDLVCARCGREAGKHRASWPEGRICGTCFTRATRTHGICPGCGQHRLLPGPPDTPDGPHCTDCAGIGVDFRCARCGSEGESYRSGICARCVLHDDLAVLLLIPGSPPALGRLVDALAAAERPESILTWKRSPTVHRLLSDLGAGRISLTHAGFDELDSGARSVEHLRALLTHCGALPARDPHLAAFERWLDAALTPLPDRVAQPVERFATWHHLRRIRALPSERSTRGPVHAAKQEITETIRFLTWLDATYDRDAASCTQQDVDEWLATGPSTRSAIRTFFVVARKTRLNQNVRIANRVAKTTPSITQDQRIAWIGELLTGTGETLPYRAAGTLLLLFAQPLVRVAGLRTGDIFQTPKGMIINLGREPAPVPELFAGLLRTHLEHRPNLRTGAGPNSPWLFPGTAAGRHLHPGTIMTRLRDLGIDLLGARNRAITELVLQAPPSLVADALGYSYQVAYRHAERGGQPWARYAGHSGS